MKGGRKVGVQQRIVDGTAATLRRGEEEVSHPREYLQQELGKAPELEGFYGPWQDNELTALLQKEV